MGYNMSRIVFDLLKGQIMKDCITLKTMQEIKIISNPIRMRVLKNYYAIGKPATVKQMAGFMGEVPANIHYHVKKLLEINVLELDHTESVNGIIAKFYVPAAKTIKIDDENSAISDGYINEKEIIVSNIFDDGKKEFVKSLRAHQDDEEKGTLFASTIEMSESQYNEVIEYMTNLVMNNETSEDQSKKKYLFFTGIIESASDVTED